MNELAKFLLSSAQGASNAVASNVSGPVDLISWALRKGGVPVPANPVGGSNWMAQHGFVQQPQNKLAGLLGEAAGLLGPVMATKFAPQVAKGLLRGAENLAKPSKLGSQAGAVLADVSSNADDAMRAVGYERGWYRGGPKIEDARKSGDWYTRVKEEAADYASRFGGNAEVREYALPSKGLLKFDASYDPRLANDVAQKVEGLGEAGAKLAKELRSYGTDRPSGMEIYKGLQKFVGDDTAMEVLQSLGFRGVHGVNSANYVKLTPKTMPRDALKAAFNPARLHENDIYGRADPSLLAGLGLLAGGGYAGYRSLADE